MSKWFKFSIRDLISLMLLVAVFTQWKLEQIEMSRAVQASLAVKWSADREIQRARAKSVQARREALRAQEAIREQQQLILELNKALGL